MVLLTVHNTNSPVKPKWKVFTLYSTACRHGHKTIFRIAADWPPTLWKDFMVWRWCTGTNGQTSITCITLARLTWPYVIKYTQKNYIENAFMLLLHLQNLGPIWKIFCLISMGVEVPATAVLSVLNEQDKWEDKVNRSSDKSRYKR